MAMWQPEIHVGSNGVELAAHGTSAFPCGCYFCDPMASETPWHWHDELEYAYVTSGELLYLAGSRRHLLRKGDAVFVNAGVPHAVQSHAGTHAMEVDLVCHPRMLYGSRDSAIWRRYLSRLALPGCIRSQALRADGPTWEREAAQLVRTAWEALATGADFFELTVRETLSRTALLVLAHASSETPPTGKALLREGTAERVRHMLRYVEDHYAEPLSLGRIAAAGGVSTREAQREFAEVIGESPTQHLMGYRLLVAARELVATNEPVGTIAHRCGFGSQSYFNKCFRARYGVTPGQYRTLA